MNYLVQIWASFWLASSLCFILLPVSLITFPIKNLRLRLKLIGPFWKLFAIINLQIGCLAKLTIIDERDEELKKNPNLGHLYISNHQSYMDIPLLLYPFQLFPIMKKEVLMIPLFGIIARTTGAIAVDRTDPESRKKVFQECTHRLKNNMSIQYYPEGTRSKDGSPKPFEQIKTALIEYAFQHKIKVIPISTYGTNQILTNKGLVKPFQKVGLYIGKPIEQNHFTSGLDYSKHCWETVTNNFNKLKLKLEN
jgi:1-acyl-sn-glycerol-3-phosphate acyltransferase